MAGEEITVDCRKTFSSGMEIHAKFRLAGAAGKTTAIFGPSGCGKTTVLRLLAGLERPDSGIIHRGDEVWSDPARQVHRSPQSRRTGFLTQDPSLFPHLSVAENVGYGLRDLDARERGRRVSEMLERLGLGSRSDSLPHQLSGGEAQRVALARALVRRPRHLLLDEPFSALDEALRSGVRKDLIDLIRARDLPTVVVTHDRRELEQLADELIVMDHGRILQSGPVGEVMRRPVSVAAARVLGFENIHSLAVLGAGRWPASSSHFAFRAEEAVVCLRGEKPGRACFSFPGLLVSIQGEGPLIRMVVDAGVSLCVLVSRQHADPKLGEPGHEVEVQLPVESCQFLE